MMARVGMTAVLVAALVACSSPPPEARAEKPEEPAPKVMAAAAPEPPAVVTEQPEPSPSVTVEPAAASAEPTLDEGLKDLPEEEGSANAAPFPAEVTIFMVDRDGCDHFLGEEPYDEDRRAYLEENIRQLCTGTDARLAELRRIYANNNDVMAALSSYEDVEGGPPAF